MIGDKADIFARLKADVNRMRWFPDAATPVLDGVLSGVASVWAYVYSLLQYVSTQTRVATASGVWLDIIARDYFGSFLARRSTETDISLLARIRLELLRPKGTRAALQRALLDLTGRNATIFEPANPYDAGGWGHTGMTAGTGLAYNVAGGYGSLQLPFQFFVSALRPSGGGVATVSGWGSGAGGYGVGAIEYASLSMVLSPVSDTDILNTINDVRPVATTAWTRISS